MREGLVSLPVPKQHLVLCPVLTVDTLFHLPGMVALVNPSKYRTIFLVCSNALSKSVDWHRVERVWVYLPWYLGLNLRSSSISLSSISHLSPFLYHTLNPASKPPHCAAYFFSVALLCIPGSLAEPFYGLVWSILLCLFTSVSIYEQKR